MRDNDPDFITYSELYAYSLLTRGHELNTDPVNYHSYGDKIILLAEKIKAERAVATMRSSMQVKEKE